MNKLKFGTDGWRAIIGETYTHENVARVAEATAIWVQQQHTTPTVIIGHDCRRGGPAFAATAAKVLLSSGVQVKLAEGIVTTPMVSLGVVKENAELGIVITASHNPAEYNGFKLKGPHGGSLAQELVQEVEALIPDQTSFKLSDINLDTHRSHGNLQSIDLEALYVKEIFDKFDIEAIRNSGLKLAYNAMHGAGFKVLQRILPDVLFYNCTPDPSHSGTPPEPIDRNMRPFAELIQNSGIACGIATDGDADRIGMYNSRGEFVDSHHIILLLIHYLKQTKGLNGEVITTFSTSQRIKRMCQQYGLRQSIVKIGFKYISKLIQHREVLLGGEESGGIAIAGHIPERDGIWIGLTIWEFMAKTGKSLEALIEEVYSIVGPFSYDRNDLHLTNQEKTRILRACKQHDWWKFGNNPIKMVESLDGYKYHFEEGEWVLIRPSGTEPVLRIYCEARTPDRVQELLDACQQTLLAPVPKVKQKERAAS